MKFRTELNLPNYPFQIHYENRLFSIGSCFAHHIAQWLKHVKFQIAENPFGILFNPISIANGLNLLLHEYEFSASDLGFHQGLWHSYHHHSCFSGADQHQVLDRLNQNSQHARHALVHSDRLLLTLGTAFVHQHKDWQGIVANCHKLPTGQFTKFKLSVPQVVEPLASVFQDLKKQQPQLEILLSVSPIRHTKEGIIENQRSKATLILAAEILCQLPFVHYFPAYEIMMDDLRDYRFYTHDLIHPSDLAIQYIKEKFSTAFFDRTTQQQIAGIEKLLQAMEHRPIHPHSTAYQQFLTQQLLAVQHLQQEHPNLDFSAALTRLQTQISDKSKP